ncbi:MAG: phosphotransferase [Dehalococcoidia bacterium]
MLADPAALLRALRLQPDCEFEVEPGGRGVERWTLCPPSADARVVIIRAHPDPELAMNHAAVADALSRAGFPHVPRPLAAIGEALVEEAVAGISALSLVSPEGSAEAAMGAFATLHSLDLREGLNWELGPEQVLPADAPPLHRLGFAAHERAPAEAALADAREAVLTSPWGFCHGDASAANVLLAPGRAWLVSLHAAGFGPQLFDVAAFLLTAGIDAPRRHDLASHYSHTRGLDSAETADLVDLAGILWGIRELLVLPRRSIELLGDNAASAALNTAAGRIERGVREPAGAHPAAVAVRAALWPS